MTTCEAVVVLHQDDGTFVWVPVEEADMAPSVVAEQGGHILTLSMDRATGRPVDVTYEVDMAAAEIERQNRAERDHQAGLLNMQRV